MAINRHSHAPGPAPTYPGGAFYQHEHDNSRPSGALPNWADEFKSFQLTVEQDWIVNKFKADTESFLIEALAGSGKTTILRYLTYVFRSDPAYDTNSVTYLAFGREFAASAREKFAIFPGNVQVLTTHQYGYKVIRANEQHLQHTVTSEGGTRVEMIAKSCGWSKPWDLARLKTLASWWRNGLCSLDFSSIKATADAFANVSITDQVIKELLADRRIADFYNLCLNRLVRIPTGEPFQPFVDFDDMLRPSPSHNLYVKPGDLFLIDEFQDFNPAQIKLVDRLIHAGARIVAVGDRNQSIHAFRSGVFYDALEVFAKTYELDVLPMTISQRSPQVGAKLASTLVPSFKSCEDAIAGEAFCLDDDSSEGLYAYYAELLKSDQITIGNPLLVIARANSTLIRHAMNFFVRRVPFYYRADVAKKLKSVLFDMRRLQTSQDKLTLGGLLDEWLYSNLRKVDKSRRSTIAYLQEVHACLQILVAPLPADASVDDLERSLLNLTAAESKRGSTEIEFHTVHSAKGLEADHIFLARAQDFPHPMAAQAWERKQEFNILYVALTRFKKRIVTDCQSALIGSCMLQKYKLAKNLEPYVQDTF